MAYNIARTRLTDFNVSWATYDFGGIDEIRIRSVLTKKEIKVGSVGDVVLGHRVLGLDAAISFAAREIDLVYLKKVHPWWTSGPISLLPAAALQDLYSYAGLLTLHPNDLAAGTVDQDRNYLKAVPLLDTSDRDGVNDDKDMVTFLLYPDRAQLPLKVYGYIGTPP
jgi:hypothetical protein